MAQAISKMETTAVKWVMNELLRLEMLDGYQMFKIFEKAIEMEKEQIMDAYGEGYVNAQNYEEIGREQFYDDTYGCKDL